MKEIIKKLVILRKVVINCKINPDYMDDLKYCTNPNYYLGFDFYIDIDENLEYIEKWLRAKLKHYEHPCLSIKFENIVEADPKNLWTIEKMERCIKEIKF